MEPDDVLHAFYATLRWLAPHHGVEDPETAFPPFATLPAPVQATWRGAVWELLNRLDQPLAAEWLPEDIPA